MSRKIRNGDGRLQVAIVSDTHGLVAPAILELIVGCDLVVHAGDVGNAQVLRALRACVDEVMAVRGNNDIASKWPAGELSLLTRLPQELRVVLPGGELVVVHGHDAGTGPQRHRRLRRRYADARAIVYGHSHRLVCDCAENPWVLNPGAAGRTRTFGGPSCLILAAGKAAWKVKSVRDNAKSSARTVSIVSRKRS
ncbi:MAG: metallophosphoesterase family protein [Acidiferrobacterales bacterium]|nr:metallophosphoesterase family protein [Acidiferrobacterales bacterium]